MSLLELHKHLILQHTTMSPLSHSDYCLKYDGFNVRALRNDKHNPNYKTLAAVEKAMIRSLTDFLRDYKKEHADIELYNLLVPPKNKCATNSSRSDLKDQELQLYETSASDDEEKELATVKLQPQRKVRRRLQYGAVDTPRKCRASKKRDRTSSEEENSPKVRKQKYYKHAKHRNATSDEEDEEDDDDKHEQPPSYKKPQ